MRPELCKYCSGPDRSEVCLFEVECADQQYFYDQGVADEKALIVRRLRATADSLLVPVRGWGLQSFVDRWVNPISAHALRGAAAALELVES